MPFYFFVNFKTYEQGTGEKAAALSRLLSSFFTGEVEIIPVVQAADIRAITMASQLKVFAQHVDAVKYGSNTGKVLPEAIKSAGAHGTVLNHAEHKISDAVAEAAVKRCREAGLKVMLCAETLERAKALARLAPDFIAVEPPELIGGDISVSTAQPSLISDAVAAIAKINPKIIPITGAGIKNSDDVSKAIELGTKGVFVASGIVTSQDQEHAIRRMLEGFAPHLGKGRKAEP